MFDINKAKELTRTRRDCVITPELEELIDKKIEQGARAGDDGICIEDGDLHDIIGINIDIDDLWSYFEGIEELYEGKGYKVKIVENPFVFSPYLTLSWND